MRTPGHTAPDRYKRIALSNTTLGVLLATLDASITLIAMPAIFRGIKLDPLLPANSFYLLWMILGFLVVTSVLVVSLGRLGDMYGRVRMYNLGFVIYTGASLLLTIDWMTGRAGATYLIVFRIVQGIGAAFLLANAAAIITDAFPADQRGMALGINNIVGVSGMFIGLILGGLLAPIDWRLVFLISVPVGLLGTVWAYLKLEERSQPRRAPVDWWGNLSFALGLILIMVSGHPRARRPQRRGGDRRGPGGPALHGGQPGLSHRHGHGDRIRARRARRGRTGTEHDLELRTGRAAGVPFRQLRPELAPRRAGPGHRRGRPPVHTRRRRAHDRRRAGTRCGEAPAPAVGRADPLPHPAHSADAFLDGGGDVVRPAGAVFETAELAPAAAPLLVAPAAP